MILLISVFHVNVCCWVVIAEHFLMIIYYVYGSMHQTHNKGPRRIKLQMYVFFPMIKLGNGNQGKN